MRALWLVVGVGGVLGAAACAPSKVSEDGGADTYAMVAAAALSWQAEVETILKAKPTQASSLSAAEKCTVPKGAILKLAKGPTKASDGNFKVVLAPKSGITCALKEGYVYGPHFEMYEEDAPKSSGGSSSSSGYSVGQANMPVVLMYHEIVANDRAANTLVSHDTIEKHFSEQMKWLADNKIESLDTETFFKLLDEKRQGKITSPWPKRSVVITFDDGYLGNFERALPILRKYNLKATFFVHTQFVGSTAGAHPKMSWDQHKLAEASGLVKVYSHTHSHPDLSTLGEEALLKELTTSRQLIEENLGGSRPFIAYPVGGYNKLVVDKASVNYSGAFAVAMRTNHDIRYNYPRMGVGIWASTLQKFRETYLTWESRYAQCGKSGKC